MIRKLYVPSYTQTRREVLQFDITFQLYLQMQIKCLYGFFDNRSQGIQVTHYVHLQQLIQSHTSEENLLCFSLECRILILHKSVLFGRKQQMSFTYASRHSSRIPSKKAATQTGTPGFQETAMFPYSEKSQNITSILRTPLLKFSSYLQ